MAATVEGRRVKFTVVPPLQLKSILGHFVPQGDGQGELTLADFVDMGTLFTCPKCRVGLDYSDEVVPVITESRSRHGLGHHMCADGRAVQWRRARFTGPGGVVVRISALKAPKREVRPTSGDVYAAPSLIIA